MKALYAIFISLVALTASALTENFDLATTPELPSGWVATGSGWAVKGGALWKNGKGDRQFAIHEQTPITSNLVVETTLVVRRRESDGWAVAGLAVHQDASNRWQFGLVEAPAQFGSTHYVELLETHAGIHHAQGTNATRLVCATKEGNRFNWEHNKPYRLRLALGGGRIEGTVHEPDGTLCARIAYLFENKPAVTAGRPAVVVGHLVAVFDDFRIEAAPLKTSSP